MLENFSVNTNLSLCQKIFNFLLLDNIDKYYNPDIAKAHLHAHTGIGMCFEGK